MNLQSQTGCEAVILLTTAVVKNKVETQGLSGVINTLQGDDSGEKKRTLLFTLTLVPFVSVMTHLTLSVPLFAVSHQYFILLTVS